MAAVNYLGFRWNQSHKYYNPYVGKGAVLFTGIIGIGFLINANWNSFLNFFVWSFIPPFDN